MPESAPQPLLEIGQQSQQSATKSSKKPRTLLEKISGLGQMVGWESIRKGMRTEDKVRDALMVARHNGSVDGATVPVTVAGDDDVGGNMVLGDMNEDHHHHHYPKPEPAKGMSGLAKAAVLAGVFATGGGAMAALPLISGLFNNDVTAVPPVEPGKTVVIPGQDRDIRVLAPRIVP